MMRAPLRHLLRRVAVTVVTGLYLNSMTFTAWADAVSAGASAGQQVGVQSIQSVTASNPNLTLKDIFPDVSGSQTTTLEGVYGDDTGTLNLGNNANTRLATENSSDGDAYRVLLGSSKRVSQDLSNDPLFKQADQVRTTTFMDGFNQNFADCKRTDVFEQVQGTAHVANYKTCERVADQGGTKEFIHDYKVGVVEYVSGQPNYQSCGVGCIYIWVGTVGDNYWGGHCAVYEEYTRFRVINRDAIISAVIERATFDDYFEIYFNDSMLWTHSPGVFPPETAGGCERATSWNVNPNKDVTTEFKADGDVLTFKTRTSVTGGGEGYARIKITFDPAKAIKDNGWGPEDRLPMLTMINDGFCTNVSVQCTSMPPKDANGCIEENGVRVCPEHIQPAPTSALDPFCRKATVSAQCSFYKGPMECYTDANGNQQCPTNGSDTCGVNHDLQIQTTGMTGMIAANGRNVVTAEFDFVAGTWRTISPSDGTRFNGSVTKINYAEVCGDKPSQIDSAGVGFWSGHGVGGELDTSIVQKVLTAPSCANGLKATVQLTDTKSDSDLEYTLTGDFRFRVSKIISDTWTPQSCIDQGKAVLSGQCSGGTIQVTKGIASEGECGTIAGVNICPGSPLYEQIKPSPLGTSRLAEQVRVTGCGTTAATLDTCQKYEKDPNCGFISQSCIQGAQGGTGACYAYEEVWDCGYDTSYPTVVNTGQTIECPGGARCMGTECFDNSNAKSGDFAYAVAMLQVAQFAEHDLSCGGDGTDIEVANNCQVFPGEAMECKKALGGYVDCCEAPEGVSIFDYVNLTMSSLKMASSVEAMARNGLSGAHYGYWQAAQEAVTTGATELIKGEWGSVVDSATGAWDKTLLGESTNGLVSQFQGWLMEQAYKTMVDMGAQNAANAIFQESASGQGMALTSQAAAVLNFVGMIYTAYVMVDLLINMIWECEPKEFELGAKKETRQCSFVGSYCASKVLGSCVEKREAYCCFSSVVGRIIQEQGRPQLGMTFGDPKNPTCEGLTPAQLGQIDWSKIDLSEWIGMLSMTGNLPTVNTVSLDNLTGAGSSLGDVFKDGERLNTLDRNLQRLEGTDPDALKRQAEQEMLNSN